MSSEEDQDQLAWLKSLTRLSMFVEVNGGQSVDTMGFHVELFTIGLGYGRRNVFFNMHFTDCLIIQL